MVLTQNTPPMPSLNIRTKTHAVRQLVRNIPLVKGLRPRDPRRSHYSNKRKTISATILEKVLADAAAVIAPGPRKEIDRSSRAYNRSSLRVPMRHHPQAATCRRGLPAQTPRFVYLRGCASHRLDRVPLKCIYRREYGCHLAHKRKVYKIKPALSSACSSCVRISPGGWRPLLVSA